MSKKVEVSRRRILGVLVVIGLASAAVGVGTFAAFSDTEQSNDNSIEAGTLDLTVNGGNSAVTVLAVDNATPGESYSGTAIDLRNAGTVDGTLNVSVASISSNENGVTDPESSVDTAGTVELESAVTMDVSVDGTQVNSYTLDTLSAGQQIDTGITLNAGQTKTFNISYSVAGSAGNEIQSDNASVDFEFELTS